MQEKRTKRKNGETDKRLSIKDQPVGGGSLIWYERGKRAVDVVGALTLLVVASPLMSGVALAIKATSPGPILIRQRRLTAGGREFTLFKFRSMNHHAERVSGATFAVSDDKRVTPVGKIIRTTRLDELPQLINVLLGDMSLIGPRPERPEMAQELGERIRGFHRRLGVKAGLTGLAQVLQGYPDDVDGYRRKLGLDMLYIRKQGFALDLWIALRTIGVVLTGSGAK
jgi:lipopolysaccharide/colanic/teichoic acid biosynthesis glycosyltransferase